VSERTELFTKVRPVEVTTQLQSGGSSSAFTLTEILFAIFISGMVGVMFCSTLSTWSRIQKKATVQSELHMEGKIALEKVIRRIREEMVGLAAVGYTSGDFTNALIVLADTDNDGTGDSLKGWGIRALDDDNDGRQDRVDSDGDGVLDTALWELVEVTSPSTTLTSATWAVSVLCRNISAPWSTADNQHTYQPFEYGGSDPTLDIGIDAVADTGDEGENDGTVSEIELGNYINTNGVIDHVGEETKITTIGAGIRLLKMSAFGDIESVIIYQGMVDPRNWQPLYYKN